MLLVFMLMHLGVAIAQFNSFPINNRFDDKLELFLTVSARQRFVEISWNHAPNAPGDIVLLTSTAPYSFEKRDAREKSLAPLGVLPYDTFAPSTEGPSDFNPIHKHQWIVNNGTAEVLSQVTPTQRKQWFQTMIPFDYTQMSFNVTKETKCYAFWASYIDYEGNIVKTQCLKAEPTWMNDMRSKIGDFRMRDLFIPGTHDSGSYIPNFKPSRLETIVTKYALTQDEDIRGQLYHGARYLDIRVGYFKNKEHVFYVTHGITRQRPLIEVVNHVRDFVLDTNEIVIFGVKEFPVGFGKDLQVHRLLVSFLRKQFGELLIDPEQSWSIQLNEIWKRRQNIFIAYDKYEMIAEFPEVLFPSVDQRWGNVRSWDKLERHLRSVSFYDRE